MIIQNRVILRIDRIYLFIHRMRFFYNFNKGFAVYHLVFHLIDSNFAKTAIQVNCILKLAMFLIVNKLLRSSWLLSAAALILIVRLFSGHFSDLNDRMRKFEYFVVILVLVLMLDSHYHFTPKNEEKISIHVTRLINNRVCRVVLNFDVLKKFVCFKVIEIYIKNVFFKPWKLLYQLT